MGVWEKCKVDGCERNQYTMGLCRSHLARELWDRRHERIERKTWVDKNQFYLENDYAVMVIDSKNYKKTKVLIDVEDLESVKKYKWYAVSDGYIYAVIKGDQVRLHRFLLQLPPGILGDHKDGNVLDNRRQNLRACNHQENCRNRGRMSNNKSGVTGVFWSKKTGKWIAAIGVDRSPKHLGCFDNFEDAVRVRREAERQYFGEFARVQN